TRGSPARGPAVASLQWSDAAGAWAADGRRFALGAIVTGQAALRSVKGDNGDLIKEVKVPGVGEIFNPTWSPDGKMIAFSAQVGGVTDLVTYDLESEKLNRLTHALYADLEPAWSHDARLIAFVTDRSATSLDQLVHGDYELAVID